MRRSTRRDHRPIALRIRNHALALLAQAINVLIDITDAIPNAVVVVACLEDLFQAGRHHLPKPKLDRLTRDPDPVRLQSERSLDEIALMLSRRIAFLNDDSESISTEMEIEPFRREHLQSLVGMRTRDVLDHFRRHRELCMRAGAWIEPDGAAPTQSPGAGTPLRLEQAWNDALSTFEMPTLDDEPQVAELLAWTIAAVSAEMPRGTSFKVERSGSDLPVEITRANHTVDRLLVAVCNRKAQGGGLKKQLNELVQRAGDTRVVVVRTAPFPSNPTTDIAKHLATLMEPKGTWRRQEIQSSDLRFLAAFRSFHAQHQAEPDFADWQHQRQPLSGIKSIHGMLALDQWFARAVPVQEAVETEPLWPTPAIKASKPAISPSIDGTLQLGETRGLSHTPVTVPVRDLMQHAAFLGGSGSGKTTAALCLIEQLLEQGVPAVLLDRKGDLCRYADPDAWIRRMMRITICAAKCTSGQDRYRPLHAQQSLAAVH